ncbi:hypothetical protein ACFWBV_09270 [Streptomyces sp. NPDC060030]|uniref:hypothetical protein n=1 Tax=Streptomyces sp. NPDC060030 TaxID=3347042 RepID=UPI003677BFD0
MSYQGVEPSDTRAELVGINDGTGMVFSAPDRVIATVTFDFAAEGRISAIHSIADPDKLGAVGKGTHHSIRTR